MKKNSPVVSVVVTTKNEEENIGNCLKSVKDQTYSQKKIEIIVVDNNSSDKTKSIAKKYTKKAFNLGPERSAQRNFAIKKSKGEYVLFLDADMSLSKKVIEECIDKFIKSEKTLNFQTRGLVGLYIPERIRGDSYWCKVRDFERSFYNGTVIDCVRFFSKGVWAKVGGFNEGLTGAEDWDFDNKVRMNREVDIIKSVLYHNEIDFNPKDYLKGKSYYAGGINKYIAKWGKDDPNIRKQLGFWYRYIAVFTEKGKWRKLFLHPYLCLGMFFLKFLVGLEYLKIIYLRRNK